jgi:segregation and condensation protein A
VSSPLNVRLAHYDGPLDLLLDLIRKQQVDVADIPIASITSQYLEVMQQAVDLDMEVSAEFVYMAATLIHIKSKMLLPKDPELEKLDPEEDPRKDLVNRLLQHERFKNAAEMLQQKRIIEEAVWSNPQISLFAVEDDLPGLSVSLFDLVKTLQSVVDRVKARPIYEVGKEDVTVPDMIRFVHALLQDDETIQPVSATMLFERQTSRRAMICLFLAILELVKRQALVLTQLDAFGDIGLRKGDGFDTLQLTTAVEAVLEEEYK